MSDGTKIEWTDATWNVVNGCSVTSPGCKHCYAMKQAHRFPVRQGLTMKTAGGMVWTGEVRFNEAVLTQPLRWKRPRRIFVCAHGDLFHENVSFEWVDRVFAVMLAAPHHIYQILTKRTARMREYISQLAKGLRKIAVAAQEWLGMQLGKALSLLDRIFPPPSMTDYVPPDHIWLGTSGEDQTRADERIPILLDTPAAKRWLSMEPLLGPVDLTNVRGSGYTDEPAFNALGDAEVGEPIDWIVLGGESGLGARPMHPDWARAVRDQCAAAGVPFLFKQWGDWAPVSDIDLDALDERVYYARPATKPDASRRSKVDQLVMQSDGRIFPMDRWHRLFGEDAATGDFAFKQGTGAMTMLSIGKKRAGRLLDGIQHDGYPSA